MIVTGTNGRRRSERTAREDMREVQDAFAVLPAEARGLFCGLLAEANDVSANVMLRDVEEGLYHTVPVPMRQFIEDPYYLGESMATLYPALREDLIALFDAPYREAVFTGSIGYGKSFIASAAMCRILYELSCMKDPQRTFGMGSGSEMVLMLVSRNLILAREVMKTAVDDKIKLSPYFMERFAPKFGTDFTLFPNNIRLTIGSYGAERALGANVFSAVLDEMNFPPKRHAQQIQQTMGKALTAAHFDIVEKVYRSLVRRIKSRFQMAGGDFPGMVIMVSSAATLESFTERKLREAQGDSTVFVRDHAPWTAKPKDHFCGKMFYVLCSKSSLRTRILKPSEYKEVTDDYLLQNEAWIIEVPVEYRDDFESNLEDSLRDIAGVSTQAISAFFQRVDAIDACITKRPHPFTSEVWVAGGEGGFKWHQICRPVERRLPGGFTEEAWVPLEEPTAPRWVHIDTSVSGDCVTADTLVATPAGNVRIDTIEAGTPVYSLGPDGRFTVAVATNPGLKRKDSPLVRVVTDGGVVRCTPDHKFMLRDGTYREARLLKEGDSLMPLYRRRSKASKRRGGGGYEEIYQPASERYALAHRLAAERVARGEVVRKSVSDETRAKISEARRRGIEERQKKNHKVLRVEDAGREDVYCLSVDGAHNFVVVFDAERLSSGVVIHNSSGFAMGRISRWVEVVRRDGDGRVYTDIAPYYVIEVLLCIRPPAGEQIYMPDLRRLVYELQAHGFPISGFSSDSFQSVEMHQQVRRRGIHTELISMDTTMQPYEELKSAIYEKRIEYYHHEVLLQELRGLEYDRLRGKVDHQRHTTKDLADALAGVVWGLRQRAARLPWAADAVTPRGELGHEHGWVSPMIPAEDVDVDEVRAAQQGNRDVDILPPFLMGDD